MGIARMLLVAGCLMASGWGLGSRGGCWAQEAPAGDPEIREADPSLPAFFASRIAPLLTRHCTECHGATAKRGRLDLSRQDVAFAGGESGPAIVPGKASESLLWEYVESDEMPENRPPLSPREKETLRAWIDAGAVWPDGAIAGATPPSGGTWMRRLTVPEYVETVRRAVGVDVEAEAVALLPRDVRADGFSNTAYSLSVDLEHVEAYAKLAEIISSRTDVAVLLAEHAPDARDAAEDLPGAIEGIGGWLLRGPLAEHERDSFHRVAIAVLDEGGEFPEAITYVVEAMLQSPRFLYRIEKQRAGPQPDAGEGQAERSQAERSHGESGTKRVGDYELASRLSYILWGGPPDKELFRAARAGELSTRSEVERQVQRMLRDPRTIERSTQFIEQWLNLEQLNYLRPDKDRFPRWHAALAADMREETLRYFQEVAWVQDRPLWELLNFPVTFATARLAKHYGLDASQGIPAASAPPAGSEAAASSQPAASSSAAGDSGSAAGAAQRLWRDPSLLALYRFDEGSGPTVHDRSGREAAVDLEIADPEAVEWGNAGLTVRRSTRIATAAAPQKLIAAIRQANAITLEAWVTPASETQSGPARLVTLSSGPSERNVTLGQDADRYEVRFRASRTNANGLPGVVSTAGAAAKRPTHIVYTRDSGGRARLYIDGLEQRNADIGGNLSTWNATYRLALANESSGDRPWLGTFHRIALFSRALSPQEVLSLSRSNTPQLRFELAGVPARGGLLTQGSVLTIGGEDASMVARGLFVLQDLLYSRVGNPPPCLDVTPIPAKPGLSRRQIAMQRVSSTACGGCHSKFEPLAFGLEKFDGLGAYHERDEHGNPLREDGEVVFPDQEEAVAYSTSAELMDLLASSDRVRMNLTRKLTQFAIGRPLNDSDAAVLEQIHQAAEKAGGTYRDLITAIVLSDLVQTIPVE